MNFRDMILLLVISCWLLNGRTFKFFYNIFVLRVKISKDFVLLGGTDNDWEAMDWEAMDWEAMDWEAMDARDARDGFHFTAGGM